MRWNRLAAVAGIGYVLLAFVEFFGPTFPKTSDAAAVLDAHFVAHHSWYLAAVVVQGVGNAVWIVFLCGLVLFIRRAGSVAAAPVALMGGALNVAISLTGLAAIAAIAFRIAGSGDAMLTKAFFEFAAMTLVLSNFFLALMAAAVAASAPVRWFRWASGLAAAVFAAGGAALAHYGALSPDGSVQFATYALELLWTLAGGIILLRTEPNLASRTTSTTTSSTKTSPISAVAQ
jgi:hypothetical protein